MKLHRPDLKAAWYVSSQSSALRKTDQTLHTLGYLNCLGVGSRDKTRDCACLVD